MKEDNDKKKSRMANNEDAEIQMQMGEQRIKKETTMGNIRVNRRIIIKTSGSLQRRIYNEQYFIEKAN